MAAATMRTDAPVRREPAMASASVAATGMTPMAPAVTTMLGETLRRRNKRGSKESDDVARDD